MRLSRNLSLSVLFVLAAWVPLFAEDRPTRVRKDREEFLAGGRWIYNDLAKGFDEARQTGKPLLAVIRCIPCDACRGFDEQVGSLDPQVRDLLERFVRVRIPQANGLDLSLFQFDYDLSFYAFFLNADRTIYGRFGARSTQEDKLGDVSIEAFREALAAVLDLHARYPAVKESLQAKTGPAPPYKVPEDYPPLKGKYRSKIDYEGKVVQSCIHCHQIRDAEQLLLREAGMPIPDRVLHSWPIPETLGLRLDPRRRAALEGVEKGSAAERAGLRAGDNLLALAGQPLVSIADVAWALHRAGEEGEIAARVRRGEEEVDLHIPLAPGWRRRNDLSWRVSAWDLRRMGTGGLLLKELSAEERRRSGLDEGKLALRVEHAGEYGDHATAKNAGVRKNDIIVAVDGRTEPLRETDLIAYAVQSKKPGDHLELTLLRDGDRKTVSFALR